MAVWGPPEKAPFFTLPMKIIAKHVPEVKPVSPGTPGLPFEIPSQEMFGGIFTEAGFSNFNSQTTEVHTFQGATAQEYWEATAEIAGPLASLLSKMAPDKKKP